MVGYGEPPSNGRGGEEDGASRTAVCAWRRRKKQGEEREGYGGERRRWTGKTASWRAIGGSWWSSRRTAGTRRSGNEADDIMKDLVQIYTQMVNT